MFISFLVFAIKQEKKQNQRKEERTRTKCQTQSGLPPRTPRPILNLKASILKVGGLWSESGFQGCPLIAAQPKECFSFLVRSFFFRRYEKERMNR